MVTHHTRQQIAGRCVTPIDRVLGTAVEASPNENRRQSSQCIRKDVGGFRLVVAGCTKPFEPARHQLPGKIRSYGWIRWNIRPEMGSKLSVFG